MVIKWKNRILRAAAALLCMAMLATGVSGCESGYRTETEDGAPPDVSETPSASPVEIVNDEITMRFNANRSLNPITGQNRENMLVAQLMYEGLFQLDVNFNAVNVLCEEYATADGANYTFKILEGVKMHDGSELFAEDVVYSIDRARESEKYGGRLALISETASTGDYTLEIKLHYAHYGLPKLLDIPIIKSGSIDDDAPSGTGAFRYVPDEGKLKLFDGYREKIGRQNTEISLRAFSEREINVSFSQYELDIIEKDPTGDSPLNIYLDHDVRYYNTTGLQYIGFNMNRAILYDRSVRKAIELAVDRDFISGVIMSGRAQAAPLLINSAYYNYDQSWEPEDTGLDYSSALLELGVRDTDGDGLIDYIIDGARVPIALDFLVNTENEFKLSAARYIADKLRAAGFTVNLVELEWNDYLKALEDGEFDIYYAETQLTADFNFSGLLSVEGALNYGKIDDHTYEAYIAQLASAPTPAEEKEAAAKLCDYAERNVPIIPVLYKKSAVYSHRGLFGGLKPTQSSVFFDIKNVAF
jgi:peptide/nickel transport system substrate-binding protein